MKRERAAAVKPFRRHLRPRVRHWLQYWLWYSGALTSAFVLTNRLIPGMSSSPIGETLVLSALISTLNLLVDVGLEWRNQPRQLRYWTDDSPPGILIRHVGTGEVLLHTENTVIQSADLHGICLEGADLRALTLPQAALRGARLRGANLEWARLDEGCFEDADLTGCRLAGAWLRRASFKRADLRGADFRGSGAVSALTAGRLDGANFFGARYNAATRWPRGFDPAAHGCAYENDAEQALPIPAALNTASSNLPLVTREPCDTLAATVTLRSGDQR